MDRHDFDRKQEERQVSMRTIYSYAMGVLWLGLGIFFINHDRFGMAGAFDPKLAVFFGVVCIFYGVFRFWRGYKGHSKN